MEILSRTVPDKPPVLIRRRSRLPNGPAALARREGKQSSFLRNPSRLGLRGVEAERGIVDEFLNIHTVDNRSLGIVSIRVMNHDTGDSRSGRSCPDCSVKQVQL